MGFFAAPIWGKMVFETYVSLRVFFGAVKLMKFQSFLTIGSSYDIVYFLVFKSSQVFAKHDFASVSIFYYQKIQRTTLEDLRIVVEVCLETDYLVLVCLQAVSKYQKQKALLRKWFSNIA